MKSKLKLTECETTTLQQLSLNHPWRDVRTRAAGLLLLASGIHLKQASMQLGVSYQTAYNWRHAWHNHGVVGLLGGHAGGRYTCLPQPIIESILTLASQEALTLKQIKERVETSHGQPLQCCDQTLSNVLKSHGYRFKRTRMSLKKTAIQNVLHPLPLS